MKQAKRTQDKRKVTDVVYTLGELFCGPGGMAIASSQDIRAALSVVYEKEAEYTIKRIGQDMIG